MAKKRLLLLVILSLLFTMASCGLDYRYQLDESKHNVFEVYWEDEDTNSTYFVYQGEKYVHTEESDVLNVYTDEYPFSDDILICWNGHRYIWYIDEYYSCDTEKPIYINCKRVHKIYFREDYDFHEDTFVIKDTDGEIVWKDMFGQRNDDLSLEGQVEVEIHSKQYLRINTSIELTMIDCTWYMSFPYTSGAWVVSDEFVNILSENGII